MITLRDSMSQFSLQARILAESTVQEVEKTFFFLFVFFPKEVEKPQKIIWNEEVKKFFILPGKYLKVSFELQWTFTAQEQKHWHNILTAPDISKCKVGLQCRNPSSLHHPCTLQGAWGKSQWSPAGLTWPSHRRLHELWAYSLPKSDSALAGIFHVSATAGSAGSKRRQRARGISPSGYS